MTVPSDMSVMDFLFQRDDSSLNVNDFIKTEMDMDISDLDNANNDDSFINEVWPTNPDEFLDSILNDGGQLEGVLDPNPSSCSDSGLSSDNQEIDQLLLGDDDDILSSTMSSPGPSVSEAGGHSSPVHSDESTSPSHHTEIFHIPEIQNDRQAISIIQPPVTTQPKANIRIQNKPLQTVTILNQKNLQQSKLSGKVIRVQTMSGNPRSILLPVSVKDLRTIKIINTSVKKNPAGIKFSTANLHQSKKINVKNNMVFAQQIDDTSCDLDMTTSTSDEEIYDGSNSETSGAGLGYPRLQLTTEEQRLLAKEGITLPTSYPLTKHEERELKRIRRKIRNKISAQDSRKRKKEYVDGLEDRVKQCTEENQTLLKRIKALQTQNQTLVSQLRRLQALVTRKVGAATGSVAGGAAIGKVQPATCLMVLLLSLALVAVPSLKSRDIGNTDLSIPTDTELETKVDEYIGKRALLFKPGEDLGEDDLNMEDLLTFHSDNSLEAPPSAKKARYEPQYEEPSLDGFVNTAHMTTMRKYIDPPLDDVWPPVDVDAGDPNPKQIDKRNASQANNVVILRMQEDK